MTFGIDIPGTVKEAGILDKASVNTIWKDATKLEMKNSCFSFKLYEKEDKFPVGHIKITCHLIFDLKLDITRKARYVAGVHLTDVPTYMTYSSVVNCDIFCIGFLMAALKNLDILAGDIQNAFLEAPLKGNIFFYAGDKWKSDKYKVVFFVRSLYGLNSSALKFRNCFAETLDNLIGYKLSLAYPDIWYKPMTDADSF